MATQRMPSCATCNGGGPAMTKRKLPLTTALSRYETAMATGEIVFDGEELYIIRDGVKIAKRYDRRWVSLQPGFHVYDDDDGIVVEFRASDVGAMQGPTLSTYQPTNSSRRSTMNTALFSLANATSYRRH